MAKGPTKFEIIKDDYTQKWNAAQIKPDWQGKVMEAAKRVAQHKDRYAAVAEKIGCPWSLVGCTHNMESTADFSKHMHCGDPLTGRTVLHPPGRPKAPPANGSVYTWEESAFDALMNEPHDWRKVPEWSIERTLWIAEAYNGWGYRQYYPHVASPYLWSGTTIYDKGKYIADRQFSATAVSQQIGVAAVMKVLESSDPNALAGSTGIGCVDTGGAPMRTVTGLGGGSQLSVLEYALGLHNLDRQRSHIFRGFLNPAAQPEILDLEVQTTFKGKGFGKDLDEDYTVEELVYYFDGKLEVHCTAYKPDPNAPPPSVFRSDTAVPLAPGAQVAPAPTGDINAAIWAAAQAYKGTSTRAGPGGGNTACAWAVTRVLRNAGITPDIGTNTNLVSAYEDALKAGRGQLVPSRQEAQPGDIWIDPTGCGHIGFCSAPNGARVLSNSSSKAAFVWDGTTDSVNAYYGGGAERWYRVVK